jgi:transposase
MLDTNDVAQRFRGRAEVRTGVIRRRRWTAEEKGRIVAEAVAPGAVIAQVARRHDMTPQHLSNWIRAAKEGRFALPADEGIGFVPVIAGQDGTHPVAGRSAIEIVAGCIVVRVQNGADVRTVEAVLRVLAGR